MIQYVFNIYCLNIKKFILGKRSILPHYTKIRTGFAILWHHFIGRINI